MACWETKVARFSRSPPPPSSWAPAASDWPGSIAERKPWAGARFVPLPDDAVFDAVCAAWAVGDLDPAGAADSRDELVGLDDIAACAEFGLDPPAEPTVMVARVLPDAGPEGPFAVETIALGDELLGPENVSLEDLDGDGDRDLVVLFRGLLLDGTGDPVGAGVGVFWNQDGTPAVTGHSVIRLPGGELSRAVPIHLDADTLADLAILTDVGLYGARFDPVLGSYGDPFLLIDGNLGKLLAVGDINGDGLDDLAAANETNASAFLATPQEPLGGPARATPPPSPAGDGP